MTNQFLPKRNFFFFFILFSTELKSGDLWQSLRRLFNPLSFWFSCSFIQHKKKDCFFLLVEFPVCRCIQQNILYTTDRKRFKASKTLSLFFYGTFFILYFFFFVDDRMTLRVNTYINKQGQVFFLYFLFLIHKNSFIKDFFTKKIN